MGEHLILERNLKIFLRITFHKINIMLSDVFFISSSTFVFLTLSLLKIVIDWNSVLKVMETVGRSEESRFPEWGDGFSI